ncbi:hypothetical protein [Pseudomonas virus PBPA162]|uniref:Uncharacterized protein n=2 Tax=Iggyvirus TaxID=3044738 RepID=A0A7S5EDN2_9CAUD|nr:hypothetical protein PQC31_gp40 [Pseudomonas phage Iggy]YP_010671777.1 hypothetical protein PQC32_gp14 [Pseudomonas virus PBPA162]QDB70848.1 hypothetical protein [Pseudomonas virus PBPA162]QEA09761.1 hypothetical protein [Pseudomonas phage Iggy]
MYTKETFKLSRLIAEAVLQDELTEGCDVAAGLFGPNLTALVSNIAHHLADYLPTHYLNTLLGDCKDAE